MMQITESMEWVYHPRGSVEESLVRKYQKACWDKLFGGRTVPDIVYELNTRWLPDGRQLLLIEPGTRILVIRPKEIVEAYVQLKKLFDAANCGFDIELRPTKLPVLLSPLASQKAAV